MILKARTSAVVIASLIRQVVVALSLVLLPFVATAETVFGRENPDTDVSDVQAAANRGGKVLLVGTFNFGDRGSVLLTNDVEISGESDPSGVPTIILGGEWPFYSPLPASMPPKRPGPKVTVQYIEFIGAKGAAVHLAYTGGASIRNNKVKDMRGRLLAPGTNAFRRSGVLIGPIDSRARGITEITPDLVSGSIDVIGNYVDSAARVDSADGDLPTRTNGGAVFMAFLRGAYVRIEDNVSRGCTRNCILVTDAIADDTDPLDPRGSVVIAGNQVISDVTEGFTGPGPRSPVGIDASFFFNPSLALNPEMRHIPLLIADNYVELNGSTAVGISVAFNGSVVHGNTVVVHADPLKASFLSGGINVATSCNFVLQNRVMGEATYGLRIGGLSLGLTRAHNVLKGNNITKMNPFTAHVLLDLAAQNNTVVGNSGTVVDNGTNNAITGLRPVKGGVGDAMSEAEQYRHDGTPPPACAPST